ncbi:glutathione S-transferase family protein [Salinarimonas rosea]|uniref:glutathione S-transferase family protein n=1 Tax=Salinarimonas rosea TaxID=552063 RepID=UPI000412E3FC|nr:glutathione S-transferase family protein [Salinarimonas rosea]
MLTFYHASKSRSDRVLWLLQELDAPVETIRTDIRRQDGSGGRDPRNPHPEGKVPALVHDGDLVTESGAILLYLTDLFPERGLGIGASEPGRGAYLTWLFWYGGVLEPVYLLEMMGVSDHPIAHTTFRDREAVAARLSAALRTGPWLMGERFTAADILLCSLYLYLPDAVPADPAVRDWIARCTARDAFARAQALD